MTKGGKDMLQQGSENYKDKEDHTWLPEKETYPCPIAYVEKEMASLEIDQTPLQEFLIVDGIADRKHTTEGKKGNRLASIFLLVNYGLTSLALGGIAVNLVLFLTRVMQQHNANAANNVSKWTGTVYILSLCGAFLSDSYFGRYRICTAFQIIYVVGLSLLSLSSWFLLLKPSGCGDGELQCKSVSKVGTCIFYVSIYMVAFGNGGYQPTVATLGSDQFDEMDPSEMHSKAAFFSYFYLIMNGGFLVSNSILGYYEDKGKWVIGFWISTASAALALVVFLLGSPRYRRFKASGNPLTRIAQVLVVVIRKWDVIVPDNEESLYETKGKGSAIAGCRKILHSNEMRWLDKAATFSGDENYIPSTMISPWRLCTVTQVEEVKCVFKMLPIWLCTIIYSVDFTQTFSLFVEQGVVMDNSIGSFYIPPASMSIFEILGVLIFLFLYRLFLIPFIGRFTKNPNGLTELQRMGVGLVIAIMAMVVAGVLEVERLRRVTEVDKPSTISILWQIPQYVLIGASEAFMYVGQLDFFNGQSPDGIKSFGSSLWMASMSLGNYLSMFIVSLVMKTTAVGERSGWIPENLNSGHLDRFFFLLAGLTIVNFVAYLILAKWYKSIRLEGSNEN